MIRKLRSNLRRFYVGEVLFVVSMILIGGGLAWLAFFPTEPECITVPVVYQDWDTGMFGVAELTVCGKELEYGNLTPIYTPSGGSLQ